METGPDSPRAQLAGTVRQQAAKLEAQVHALMQQNSRYIYASIMAGALAAFLSGMTAIAGKPFAEALGGWRIVCAAAAGLTLIATASNGLHKAFTVSERLAKATACLGRLKAIDLALTVRQADPVQVACDYEDLLAANGELMV